MKPISRTMCQHSSALEPEWNREITRCIFLQITKNRLGTRLAYPSVRLWVCGDIFGYWLVSDWGLPQEVMRAGGSLPCGIAQNVTVKMKVQCSFYHLTVYQKLRIDI